MELFKICNTSFINVSIIIPFHNSEKYIDKCLDSIISGTHIKYEIICIDDGSTDNSAKIVKQYCKNNKRIKLISLGKQYYLYHARLEGIKYAKGKYIGFADSDDVVSEGYFNQLYNEIKRTKSDIAISTIVNVDKEKTKYIQTRCAVFPYLPNSNDIREKIYDLYWQQSGKCYHWHVLWNKLYKRKLIKNAIPLLEKQVKPMVMMEDFVYSSVILEKAKKYVVVNNAKYYYIAHSDASVCSDTFEKIHKCISDIHIAFDFVESYLKQRNIFDIYKGCFSQWKERYGRYWKRNVLKSSMSMNDKSICLNQLDSFIDGYIDNIMKEDEWYYEIAEILDK